MDQTIPPSQPFDVAVMEELRVACREVMLRHPEVGAVAVAVNWKGNLNDAKINHGIWVAPEGDVTSLEGIFGSTGQVIKLLDWMMGRGFKAQQSLRETGIKLGQEVIQLNEQKQSLESRCAALTGRIAEAEKDQGKEESHP